MKQSTYHYKGLLVFMLLYGVVCFLMLLADPNFLYFMLPWNILLAVLPLLFVRKAEQTGRRAEKIFFLFLWLFFFPNSVYLITDFIHISSEPFVQVIDHGPYEESEVLYSRDLIIWMKLLMIGLAFFFASITGLESLYIFEGVVRGRFSAKLTAAVLAAVAVLTGIGIYIGRFLRFNSWDVLFDPLNLLKEVFMIDLFAVQFTLVFAIFVAGIYWLYRFVRMLPAR